jgi:cytochrome c oxidase subunit 3
MPSIFTPIPAETERKSPGIGGKPPVDRRPTGGGGGGGDDDSKNSRRGPRELLQRTRAFVFCALAGDMMFFVVLVTLFYARQASTHMDPATLRQIGDWHPVLLPPILFLNTAVLLLASLTMEIARRRIFREIDVLEEWLGLGRPALRNSLPWLAATLALGSLFLAGQVAAWKQLTEQGFAFDHRATPASYFFYLVSGLHAAHLVLGLVALAFCVSALGWLKRVEYRQIAVDLTAWYWHAMGMAWLILFAILVIG